MHRNRLIASNRPRQELQTIVVIKKESVPLEPGKAEAAVIWAEDHLFDRRSVVREQEIWRHALEHLRGKGISIRDIQEATAKRNYLRHPKNPGCVTLQEVLEREWDIVCLAKNDLKHVAPFFKHVSVNNPSLNLEQLKTNGRTKDGKRLAKGELVTIKQVLKNGRIRLQDGRLLEEDYRAFVRGYAVTSYAAQGKTLDYVLFSDSAIKPATNQQQWYVTISRGRRGIKIFTSDKVQLRENIVRSGDRELAMDMADRKFIQRLGIPLWLVRGVRNCREYAMVLHNSMYACFNALRARALHPENPAQKP